MNYKQLEELRRRSIYDLRCRDILKIWDSTKDLNRMLASIRQSREELLPVLMEVLKDDRFKT